jgi:hypothetical protein
MIMQDSNPRQMKTINKRQVRFFWSSLLTNTILFVALFLEILLPAFIDGLFGHVWGSLAAVANIIGWFYYGMKLKVTISTRIFIWVIPFIFVVLIAVVEFAHLFHWQLTSK